MSKQDKYIDDPDFLRSLVQTFLQEYLEAEIAEHLGAGKHERVSSRVGHRRLNYFLPMARLVIYSEFQSPSAATTPSWELI